MPAQQLLTSDAPGLRCRASAEAANSRAPQRRSPVAPRSMGSRGGRLQIRRGAFVCSEYRGGAMPGTSVWFRDGPRQRQVAARRCPGVAA